ncbi:MAG: hypothetical protein WBD02_04915 [Acidimicrobiia bacterium]
MILRSLRAEFLKLRTIRSPWITVVASSLVGALLMFFAVRSFLRDALPSDVPFAVRNEMDSRIVGQVHQALSGFMQIWHVAALAWVVSMISGETRDGFTRVNLVMIPRRWMYAFNKVVSAAAYFAIGTVAALACHVGALQLALAESGFHLNVLSREFVLTYLGWIAYMTLHAPIAVALGLCFRRGPGGIVISVLAVVIDGGLAASRAISWMLPWLPFANGYTLPSDSHHHQVNVDPNALGRFGRYSSSGFIPEYHGVVYGTIYFVVVSLGLWAASTWWFARRDA